MLNEILSDLFERDLNKLIVEIKAYTDENDLWKIKDGISNSAGNLSLHLIGNLNHFIGAILGGTGYIRNREAEFILKSIPSSELIRKIEDTIVVVKNTIANLSDEDFEKDFPLEVFGKPLKTGWLLVHLATHLDYHLGQINYHRRLIS